MAEIVTSEVKEKKRKPIQKYDGDDTSVCSSEDLHLYPLYS